ncbi:hypothetical protein [Chitinimonas sp. BJYL2]|uniref:hypothetical protein n=1 Tax=Chitinimonas sp. BJYL2 TaxID=2976696 RepID=UPI0022B4D895|nr:hypothetical protein [Chitinimonas sp. BJYL2]
MNLLYLLNLALKSDEVIEVLEDYNITVVYDFDRFRENSPDLYWASSADAGFELRFNERQVLDTIFMYASPRHSFNSVASGIEGVPCFNSFEAATEGFKRMGIAYEAAPEGNDWIKGDFNAYQVHYEFCHDGALGLVTIMATNA